MYTSRKFYPNPLYANLKKIYIYGYGNEVYFLFRSGVVPDQISNFRAFPRSNSPVLSTRFLSNPFLLFLFGCKSVGTIARKEASAGINRKLSPMPSILPVNFREEHASTRFISSAREQIWLNDDLFPRGSCPGKLVTLEPRQVSINFNPCFANQLRTLGIELNIPLVKSY